MIFLFHNSTHRGEFHLSLGFPWSLRKHTDKRNEYTTKRNPLHLWRTLRWNYTLAGTCSSRCFFHWIIPFCILYIENTMALTGLSGRTKWISKYKRKVVLLTCWSLTTNGSYTKTKLQFITRRGDSLIKLINSVNHGQKFWTFWTIYIHKHVHSISAKLRTYQSRTYRLWWWPWPFSCHCNVVMAVGWKLFFLPRILS